MKKVLAIVLALVLTFSFASVASAADISKGQLFFGPKSDLTADPGDTVTVEIEFKADCLDTYDTEGTVVIPFWIMSDNLEESVIEDVRLAEGAAEKGVELIFDEELDMFYPEQYTATVRLPASYLYGGEAIDVLDVDVSVSETWEIADYEAVRPISISVLTGYESFFGMPITVESADESSCEIYDEIVWDVAIIRAKPYQPTFTEKLVEWLKEKAAFLCELIVKGLTYVVNEFLQPADWNKPVTPDAPVE